MRFTVPLKNALLAALALGVALQGYSSPQGAPSGAIRVEIIEVEGGHQLLRGGKPYRIKGAGIDHSNLDDFAAMGGNSFRTWAVDDGPEPAQQLLDRAHALNLTVSLCLEFARERHGFDYNDKAAVARQAAKTSARVQRYKDHPALLTWIVGNELNFDFKNPRVYDAVNDVARMIHEIDPNHPVTSTIAGFDKKALQAIASRAPDLDFISFQMYADLVNLPKYLEKSKLKKPIFVTEWGTIGHWEVWKTKWGAPVENTSTEKAGNYAKSYLEVLASDPKKYIGNYVFLWGQKQEKTSTWYGMFLDSGEKTEAVDVMHYTWNGVWPKNRAPRVSRIALDNKTAYDSVIIWHGKSYKAKVNAVDPDNDEISYRWEVRHESTAREAGGDKEAIPEVVPGLITGPHGSEIALQAPQKPGPYRLFVYAYDGQGSAGHANIPFYVR